MILVSFGVISYSEVLARMQQVCSSINQSGTVTFQIMKDCNVALLGQFISAYDSASSASLDNSLAAISNCPDVEAYWQIVSPLLWTHVFPVILSMSACQIIFRIVQNIIHDT